MRYLSGMTLDIVFTILLFLGVFFTCIPTVPGVPTMFGLIFIYSLIDNFTHIAVWHLAIFGAIALISIGIDYFSGLIGAKLGGANKTSLLFGIFGLFIGLFAFPPFGAFLGMFIGVFASELLQFHDRRQALKAASYSLVTVIAGAITNVLLGVGMFIAFLILIF